VLATGSSYTKQSPEKMAWAGVSEWQGIIAAYLVETVDGVDATAKTLTAAAAAARGEGRGEAEGDVVGVERHRRRRE
jgi:hypothetical protein